MLAWLFLGCILGASVASVWEGAPVTGAFIATGVLVSILMTVRQM